MAQSYVKIRKGANPAQNATGTNPMSIEGRMAIENERMAGMTTMERAWRKQWLKDQELSPREPVFEAELQMKRNLLNPLRKLYGAPLDWFFLKLVPTLGYNKAAALRFWTPKALLGIGLVYFTAYHLKYNSRDWSSRNGWYIYTTKAAVFPGMKREEMEPREPSDYCDRGFKARTELRDLSKV
ncbi:PREDICTED: uncharacterized protein LOC106815283 [Priapulus caudatus]|uniref:Uncharacterized protein LOC106815283 n=1 Tax=Priapulus caudatus TaxID=37621 RepID=A0ABM1ESP5_PRICU|nr:PREDICTED: uncharacterized protein LOC106815283 [Priapulus caudatus]